MPHMHPADPIYIAGHAGMVGSAIVRELTRLGYTNLIARTRAQLDLLDTLAVDAFFTATRPKFVILAAAKVGGILANNTYPADFIRDNLILQTNVIDAARRSGVDRLLFLGSSCIYPRLAPQPISEDSLLTGPLEPTNRPYALAKIAGIELCWSCNRQYGTRFLAAMPANMYGPGENFDPRHSHVMAALMLKVAEALRTGAPHIEVWGTGNALREFLYSEDCAQACVFLMNLDGQRYDSLLAEDRAPLINIGSGEDISIRGLALLIAQTAGFSGGLVFDTTKPDGTPRKLLDVARLHALGWHRTTTLEAGIAQSWNRLLQTRQ